MTDGYDCCQNPLAARITGIFKSEFLLCSPADLARLDGAGVFGRNL